MATPEIIVREWFREVWDGGREEAVDRLMAPWGVCYGLPGGPVQGPTDFKPIFKMFKDALSDLNVDIVRVVAQDDLVAVHCHVTARHTGTSLGGAASSQPVDFWGVAMMRVEEDKIAECWNCFDMLSMYQQIGWIPTPPGPAAAG